MLVRERKKGRLEQAGRQGFLEVEGQYSEAGVCSKTWLNRGSGTALFQL